MRSVIDRSQTGIPGNPHGQVARVARRASRPASTPEGSTRSIRTPWRPDDLEGLELRGAADRIVWQGDSPVSVGVQSDVRGMHTWTTHAPQGQGVLEEADVVEDAKEISLASRPAQMQHYEEVEEQDPLLVVRRCVRSPNTTAPGSLVKQQAPAPVRHARLLYVVSGGTLILLVVLGILHVLALGLVLSAAIFLLLLVVLGTLISNWERVHIHPLLYVGLVMLLLLVGYAFAFQGYVWGTDTYNDAHYGLTRTFQLDAVVGHRDTAVNPTHLIALNLHGRIEIIEFQGGDPAYSKVYPGPQLTGSDAQKSVVTLEIQDGQRSGKPNILVHVAAAEPIALFTIPSTTYTLLNTGDAFRPAPQAA